MDKLLDDDKYKLYRHFGINEPDRIKLEKCETLDKKDLESLADIFGLKSSNIKILRNNLKEINWFLSRNQLPPNYLVGYKKDFKEQLDNQLYQSIVTQFQYRNWS